MKTLKSAGIALMLLASVAMATQDGVILKFTPKKGDVVKLAGVVPQGPVISMRMDEDGNVSYLIEWTDVNGRTQQRWFAESDLAAV